MLVNIQTSVIPMQFDYYSLLGVDPDASREVLKRAFRSRLLAVHPDHNPEDHLADEHTRLIIEAYNTLGNPLRRRQYDQSINSAMPAIAEKHRCPIYRLMQLIIQAVIILCMAAFTILITVMIIHILDNQAPVYRPDVKGLQMIFQCFRKVY